MMLNSLAGLPAFLAYFAIGLIAYAIFAGIYSLLTPHKEIELVRAGNTAAVVGYLGAIIGFGIPLASAAANSIGYVDFAIWAVVALVAQVIAFYIAGGTMKNLHTKITDGNVAAGIWAAGIAIAVGLLNAACMTY